MYTHTSLCASHGQPGPHEAEGLLGENPGWRRLGPSAGLRCSQLLQWVAESVGTLGIATLQVEIWLFLAMVDIRTPAGVSSY